MQYKVVTGDNATELESNINKLLKDGWNLYTINPSVFIQDGRKVNAVLMTFIEQKKHPFEDLTFDQIRARIDDMSKLDIHHPADEAEIQGDQIIFYLHNSRNGKEPDTALKFSFFQIERLYKMVSDYEKLMEQLERHLKGKI